MERDLQSLLDMLQSAEIIMQYMAGLAPNEFLTYLQLQDAIIIPPKDDKILGQTLLITARLTKKTKQRDRDYLRNLADQCCKNLLGDKTPSFSRAGELFDSAIFE